jgi:hypothetical protein
VYLDAVYADRTADPNIKGMSILPERLMQKNVNGMTSDKHRDTKDSEQMVSELRHLTLSILDPQQLALAH